MIDRDHKLPLARQAKAVGISRGSIYYRPRPVGEAGLGLMRRIDELHVNDVDVQRLCQGNGPAIMSVVAVSSQ